MAGETQQMKGVLESSGRGEDESVPVGMAMISAGASELINTGNYSNVTVGPILVKRIVPDDENLMSEIQKTQSLCEKAVAEERETVQILLRSNAQSQAK